jgi:hypothetical protein
LIVLDRVAIVTGLGTHKLLALAAKTGKPDQLLIDATHLKARLTAASLLKKGLCPDGSGAPKAV